jgi:hypothetical protein
MRAPLDTVNQFLELTSPKGRDLEFLLPQISKFLAEDFVFTGPLMTIEGRTNYLELLRKFLGVHVSLRVRRQFVENEDVCSINDLTVKSPAGAMVTMPMAEWFRLKDGVIHAHEIFYDPREFARAFGM